MRKEIVSSVTERGQVTVPAEVRKLLGLDKKGPLTWVIEDGVVQVRRPGRTLEQSFGAIRPVNSPEDWDARIREAREDKAEETLRKLRSR